MLGTIEDLEKDIELFQKNIAASGEMVRLLSQMLEQIKAQNEEFGSKSQTLIQRVEGLPGTIEATNNASNSMIQGNVATELGKALNGFATEQAKYLQELNNTKQQISSYVEQINVAEQASIERGQELLKKVESVLNAIEAENQKNNSLILESIKVVMEEAVQGFAKEQEGYQSDLKKTQESIGKCEEMLTTKYGEFIESLEKMNISNLYEQNTQIKKALDKRTLVLMIISGLSLVIGMLGIFM